TQIGSIRMDEARYAEAEDAFAAAYQRAAALVERHPDNGDMLFERAQAEFWIGYVAWRRGNLGHAREWLTRYRSSAAVLNNLEGNGTRAQFEVVYGHHNLAVLELEDGNLPEARRELSAERRILDEMLSTAPRDPTLLRLVADN